MKQISARKRYVGSKQLEAMSAEVPDRLLVNARKSFDRLTNAAQYTLVSEVAFSRRREFVRLINSVVTVSHGLRRRRNDAGEDDIHYEPCVIFFVRKKLESESLGQSQRIPSELLAHVDVDGQRVLCAVPTDVQSQERLLDVRAQALNGIYAQANTGYAEYGAITCVVQDDNDRLYAISALHVLSPSPAIHDGGLIELGTEFFTTSTAMPPLGDAYLQASAFGGRLVRAPGESLDVQLAEVLNLETLRNALAGLRLSKDKPYVESESELHEMLADGRRLLVLVPENHPRYLGDPRQFPEATLSGGETGRMIHYNFAGAGTVYSFQNCIELQIQPNAATEAGDSGSPVVIPFDDTSYSLVGMHIAGDSARRTSTVIPAWRFLNPFSYEDVQGVVPSGALRLCTVF